MTDRVEVEQHHCGGCGAALKYVARYEWYFCHDCVDLAKDFEGRRIGFFNTGPLGGFGWHYVGEPDRAMVDGFSKVLCFIKGRRVEVCEARFGGIVAQPFNGIKPTSGIAAKMYVDLTRKANAVEAHARMRTRKKSGEW